MHKGMNENATKNASFQTQLIAFIAELARYKFSKLSFSIQQISSQNMQMIPMSLKKEANFLSTIRRYSDIMKSNKFKRFVSQFIEELIFS